MTAKYKVAITAGIKQHVLESGMKPQNALEIGGQFVCPCNYEVDIYIYIYIW